MDKKAKNQTNEEEHEFEEANSKKAPGEEKSTNLKKHPKVG
jgi:hypothetical protein